MQNLKIMQLRLHWILLHLPHWTPFQCFGEIVLKDRYGRKKLESENDKIILMNTVLLYIRLATRFKCWDVLKKIDLDVCGPSTLRFPSEMLLTTLLGLFSSEPENIHQTATSVKMNTSPCWKAAIKNPWNYIIVDRCQYFDPIVF